MSSKIVYLNKFVSEEEAAVTPFDMGFMFGGSIYEVCYVYGGDIFTMELHWDRLFKCAEIVGIKIQQSRQELSTLCKQLLEKNKSWFSTGIVYLQVSFGGQVGYRSSVLPVCKELTPTLFMFCQMFEAAPLSGVKMTSCADKRWRMCHIKSCSLIANVVVGNTAKQNSTDEALLYDPDTKIVHEGSNTNVFAIFKGELWTYPIQDAGDRILHGITRLVILDLAKKLGIPVQEKTFTLQQVLHEADEVFISSTTKEVCPVASIDDIPCKSCPGPISLALAKAFVERVEEECPAYKPHPKRSMHPALQ